MRLAILATIATLVFAGCSSSDKNVEDLYVDEGDTYVAPVPDLEGIAAGDPTKTVNVTFVNGTKLQATVNGTTAASHTILLEMGHVDTTAMSGPEPMGGGGETTALNSNATLDIEIGVKDGDRLGGYQAALLIGDTSSFEPKLVPWDPSENITLTLEGFGLHFIALGLWEGEPAFNVTPAVIYNEPVLVGISGHWTATGEVQPFSPPTIGTPTPRDSMVDKFALDLQGGLTMTVTTAYNGASPPVSEGTDIDLGIYLDGAGLVCSGAGSPSLPGAPPVADPGNAAETATLELDEAGPYTVEIGSVQGCLGMGFQYLNHGPVPYTVDILYM